MITRAGRKIILPLVGHELAMSDVTIGYLTSLSFLLDAVFFPVAGYMMDKLGRLSACFSSLLTMALALLCIPMFGLSTPIFWIASIYLGCGNGLSSGVLLTIGADIAPLEPTHRGAFLGIFRALTDSGELVGPLLVGRLSDSFGVEGSAFLLSLVAFVGALSVGLVPETKNFQQELQEQTSRVVIGAPAE